METPDLVEVEIESIRKSRLTEHPVVMLRAKGGGQVRRVVVNRIAEQTFYAEIMLEVGDQTHLIDARPSDAIALAVRTNAPVFVARAVLETAGAASEVDMIRQNLQTFDGDAQLVRLFVQQFFQSLRNRVMQHLAAVLRAPDEMILQRINATRVLFVACRTHVLSIAHNSMPINYLLELGSPALSPADLMQAVPAPWRCSTSYKGVAFLWMQREAPEVIGAGPFLRKDPVEQTWALVLTAGLGTAQQRSISLQEFTSAEWPSGADSRDIEWEGRNMLAVALPGSAERETWLIVKPNFWEQFTTVTIEPVTSPQPNPPTEGE